MDGGAPVRRRRGRDPALGGERLPQRGQPRHPQRRAHVCHQRQHPLHQRHGHRPASPQPHPADQRHCHRPLGGHRPRRGAAPRRRLHAGHGPGAVLRGGDRRRRAHRHRAAHHVHAAAAGRLRCRPVRRRLAHPCVHRARVGRAVRHQPRGGHLQGGSLPGLQRRQVRLELPRQHHAPRAADGRLSDHHQRHRGAATVAVAHRHRDEPGPRPEPGLCALPRDRALVLHGHGAAGGRVQLPGLHQHHRAAGRQRHLRPPHHLVACGCLGPAHAGPGRGGYARRRHRAGRAVAGAAAGQCRLAARALRGHQPQPAGLCHPAHAIPPGRHRHGPGRKHHHRAQCVVCRPGGRRRGRRPLHRLAAVCQQRAAHRHGIHRHYADRVARLHRAAQRRVGVPQPGILVSALAARLPGGHVGLHQRPAARPGRHPAGQAGRLLRAHRAQHRGPLRLHRRRRMAVPRCVALHHAHPAGALLRLPGRHRRRPCAKRPLVRRLWRGLRRHLHRQRHHQRRRRQQQEPVPGARRAHPGRHALG